MTKAEIRNFFLQKRLSLTDAEYERMNQLLCDRFFASVELPKITLLHTFLPIVEKKEPFTWLIIDRVRKEFPHIHIAVPRIRGSDLEHMLLEDSEVEINKWGIPEPRSGSKVATEKIDMVLVPLLAFDKEGHRVGYGKGYYDRFLKNCRSDAQRIGLSFFPPVDRITATPHDMKLSSCVTAEKYYVFA
jgi:5-formyltetrahydrofolate cyclo-ligase